jgi:uncharacterized protein (TIGR03085 family)
MSTASLTETERSELCDLMLEVGPAAPTLNEGWQVLDLAAHLVAREHDLWATGGLLLRPLAGVLDMAMKRRRRRGLDTLVATIRAGEPVWWRLAPRGAQLTEYYIHHEDVRRPNGRGPRRDRPDLDQKLGRLVAASARIMLRRVDSGVELRWNEETFDEHGPEPRAILEGPPGELLLYLSGRRQAAVITLGGDADAVAALESASLGV